MSQALISGGGAFTRQNISDINNNFSQLFAGLTVGNVIYCNPATSYMGPQDGSYAKPYNDLAVAYSATRNGMNDVVVLVGTGSTSGSWRIASAFTWANDATHLIGVCSPVLVSQRARIAPASGTTAFANFFTVSGNGCIFQNVQFYAGFATGVAAGICMTVTGGRNYFQNCQFAGMADTASAQSATSRALKVGSGGSGENVFVDCTIGVDTVTRTVANANLELAGATPRNLFRRCLFPVMTSSATTLTVLGTGAGCIDRENTFEDCVFVNAIKSTSTGQTAAFSLTNAAPGGLLIVKGGILVGATKFGDTNALANTYIDMAAVSASAGGLGVNPS